MDNIDVDVEGFGNPRVGAESHSVAYLDKVSGGCGVVIEQYAASFDPFFRLRSRAETWEKSQCTGVCSKAKMGVRDHFRLQIIHILYFIGLDYAFNFTKITLKMEYSDERYIFIVGRLFGAECR